jgi:hypothetical protein
MPSSAQVLAGASAVIPTNNQNARMASFRDYPNPPAPVQIL